MASLKSLDAYAAYLAAQNAKNQENIAAQLALALFPLWQIVRFQDLDRSMKLWLPSVLPRIKTAYLQSQRVQAVFISNARFAALPTEDPLPIGVPDVEAPAGLSPGAFQMPDIGSPANLLNVFDEFPAQDAATSMQIAADYQTKAAMPGPEDELMQNALTRSSGAGIRHAINGSRGVTANVVQRDRKIIGYARVTDAKPCAFCALLASRGAVYSKDSFIESDSKFTANPHGAKNLPDGFRDIAKVHNSCTCTLRPVYSKSSAMDSAAKYWRDGWDNIYKADPYKSNANMIKDFREWHDKNPFEGSQFDLHSLHEDLTQRAEALADAGFALDSPQVKWADQALRNLAA